MKIKLIESGGFTGRTRFAEEDISHHSKQLIGSIENAFYSEDIAAVDIDPSRDKKKYFIEYNDRSLPVESIVASPELKALIEKLKKNLHY